LQPWGSLTFPAQVRRPGARCFFFGNDAESFPCRDRDAKDCIEACCEHAYSLYRIGDLADLVLENFYDCDV
jgi:hypothetical protein